MPIARLNLRAALLGGVLSQLILSPQPVSGAGVTVITHGWNGTTTNWVQGMASALTNRIGASAPVYRLTVEEVDSTLQASVSKLAGGDPTTEPSGEVVLLLDWGDVSGGSASVGDYSTYEVAAAAAPVFFQTNAFPELEGHAIAELPIHAIGHSRGGSLVCELSKKLGEHGIWADQVTALDAHPLDNDAPPLSYENVLFADSYYETNSFLHLVDGEPIPGSFSRVQTNASGGYEFPFNWHSDVHLWYHGTISLATPTSNGDGASITSTMRDTWWTSVEQRGTNAGFVYTSLGGGDRLSTNQPSGNYSSPIRDGFNRYYDVGGGAGPNNRTAVGSNSGEWPNPIRFELLTTNSVQHGDTATLEIYFQWAQPNTSTQSVQVLADPDWNPLNGNEVVLEDGFATGTTVAQVTNGIIDVDFDGSVIAAGEYHLCVKMTATNRSRFLYASQAIDLSASTQPLWLDITMSTNSTTLLGINGMAGQTAVVEMSVDGLPWQPLATNALSSSRWEVMESIDPAATLTLFRARLLTP